jgi:hypothetical protein
MDAAPEAIEDSAELRQVRRQARKVRIESAILALILTGIVVAIPTWR